MLKQYVLVLVDDEIVLAVITYGDDNDATKNKLGSDTSWKPTKFELFPHNAFANGRQVEDVAKPLESESYTNNDKPDHRSNNVGENGAPRVT